MSKTIYERISKLYDDIDKRLKIPSYYRVLAPFNYDIIIKYDIKKLNTLKIIIELINNKNNIEIDNIFDKYIKNFKFKKEYYVLKVSSLIKFDTFENITDFIDKLENVRINGDINNSHFYDEINMYDELYDILLKVQEQEKLEEVKKTSIKINVKKSETIKDNDKKKKKKTISATIKRLVWNTNIGEDVSKSKCMCCYSTDIIQLSFNCGHIIAEANGGETIVSNLKPICQNCNSSMGTKNMEEFMKSLK